MTFVRLSIPGNACVPCGAIMGDSLVCPGCGWVDPLTGRVKLPWYFDLATLLAASAFEATYARASGGTVRDLHRFGRFAEPCDCGWEECEGWQMGHQWEDAIVEDFAWEGK